ncbi:hypothetical protein PN498_15450 [Oscillatoria sp. CS-180]|uniref:hypothetical protein n=1 Tax=Oscillatoria sp. CS-180 TaxID=3021720 RepID=UPI00232EB4BD|nr:hypothetical protein [Oscillatoria sp. CS-180]MDB9527394.1 hypothetical protein [Oscillatoria sp. CS-180]
MKSAPYFISGIKRLQSKIRLSVDALQHEIEDELKLYKVINEEALITNQKEIRVVGLRRSGNHAIMNWLRKQHAGEVFYINNACIKVNPFRQVYKEQVRKRQDPSIGGWRTDNIERWRREAKGDFVPKDCLIYSYEDQPITAFSDRTFERRHDLYFGRSKVRYDLIIMRDPFNLFASRLRANERGQTVDDQMDFMKVKSRSLSLPQLWQDYAQEYLNETNYLQNIKVPVNYNRWVLDRDYRSQIAEKLAMDFTDAGFNDVMTNGGGSSFDGVNLNGKASEMLVLERWRKFSTDERFKAMISYPKIRESSTKIFGHIPGIETLYE